MSERFTPDFPPSRKAVDARGGQLEPDGDQTPRVTGGRRGKYPLDGSGPAKPNSSSAKAGGPSGSPYESDLKYDIVEPVATRPTPTAPTTSNPLK
jgi:hypothetical protein